ncbi:YitT family protein [Bacteroidales bacterium OttesenSCG-928-M11]|nr:YitT family protein [Bacteroidales bacterium OttesenSCG-928-M11]
MKIQKQVFIREFKDYMLILVGLFFYAFGWTGFLLPCEITTGGVTGVAAIIYFATGMPVAVSYFTINSILLLFSIKLFGFKFTFKTILNVFILTFLLSFLQELIKEPLVKEETFMNGLIGGVLCGVGLGLIFNHNGSTGGTDIIALIINKYKKGVSIGKGLLLCDVLIISSSWLIFGSVEKIVYGLVIMAVISYTVDLVLNGARQSVQFFIFSKKHEEIADAIIGEAHRGCTVLDGTGWYSKKPTKVIVVMAKKTESTMIFRLVKGIDPDAFISQSVIRGVYGKGFDQITV